MSFVNTKNKMGFSMVELVIYLAILSFVAVFVVFSVDFVGNSYKKLKAEHAFTSSAQLSFDRIIREVREAREISLLSSLGSHPGVLVLQPGNKSFYIDNGVLFMQEGTNVLGRLTMSDVVITNLVFRKIETGRSEAIVVEMTLSSSVGGILTERDFQTTAVLRGSY